MSDQRKRYLEAAIYEDLVQKMVFLAGPRQIGKTTLAKMIGGRYRQPVYLGPRKGRTFHQPSPSSAARRGRRRPTSLRAFPVPSGRRNRDRGRESGFNTSPPSELYRRISRIQLSS